VTGAGAMPNPDKMAAKQKLQQKMAEAAQTRSKGTAGDSEAAGNRGTAPGAGGTGRQGGNIFGFVAGSTDSATGKGSGGTGGTGGKKKVVKKPPPNFGGGVLGKK
jgi:hypothetical protein